MASRTLKVNIVADASPLSRALGKASKTSDTFGKSMLRVGKFAAVGLAALGAGAAVAGKQMIGLASDAAEVQSKMEVVFGRALPKLTQEIDKFSAATGTSRFALREQVADMGALLEPLTANKSAAAAMSLQFTKLATDLGSFNNVPTEEALLAIRSGLVGEAEPLRRFGVLLNEAAVKQEALRLGLVKGKQALTEQQKVQARASLIMKQTTLAQGDAERTAGSMANQMKRLKSNISDTATSIGMTLLPAALGITKVFNDVFAAKGIRAKLNVVWEGIQDAGMKLTSAIGAAVAMIDWGAAWSKATGIAAGLAARFEALDWTVIGAAIGTGLATGIGQASVIGKQLSGTLMETVRTIDWVAFGRAVGPGLATALVVAFTTLLDPAFWAKNWDLALAVGLAVFTRGIGKLVAPLGASIAKTLGGAWERGILAIAQAVEKLSPRIAAAVLSGLLSLPARVGALLGALTGVVSSAMGRLGRIARFTIRVLGIQAAIAAVGEFASWVKRKFDELLAYIRDLPSKFTSAAYSIGSGIASGIASGVGGLAERLFNALKSQIDNAIQRVKGWFGISSPSKYTAEQVGKPLGEGVVTGMDGGLALLAPKMQAKIKAALDRAKAVVDAARGRMEASFSLLSDKLLRAFDAETSGFRTGAEMELDTINARRQAEALQKALADAVASDDQEAIARAREDIHMAALEKQAANERKAYEDQRNTMRENLENRLNLLGQHFKAEGATVSMALASITRLMNQYGITFEEAGAYIGKSFLFGLQQAIGGAAATAGGVRGGLTGGNTRPTPPIVTQIVLDGKVVAESVRTQNAIYQRANGGVLAV